MAYAERRWIPAFAAITIWYFIAPSFCAVELATTKTQTMIKITVLPNETLCPKGAEFSVPEGTNLCEALLEQNIRIEHACELSCACTTCHVVMREGGQSLDEATENEEDMLDMAWGLTAQSRLSCQTIVRGTPLVIEIPKYTINHAREDH